MESIFYEFPSFLIQNVTKQHFSKKCRHFQSNVDSSSLPRSSSNSISAIHDREIMSQVSWNCHFKGHLIITPSLGTIRIMNTSWLIFNTQFHLRLGCIYFHKFGYMFIFSQLIIVPFGVLKEAPHLEQQVSRLVISGPSLVLWIFTQLTYIMDSRFESEGEINPHLKSPVFSIQCY